MATRSIVTSQPDVACDVCARRLLRGEQSDIFLAAGQRHTVCELCAPRATHQGWLRETEHDSSSAPTTPTRRGLSLFGRLRQGRRAAAGSRAVATGLGVGRKEDVPNLDGVSRTADELAAPIGEGRAERAINAFNAGEHPRRVAGVARSLGAPSVNVRPDEDVESLVSIVIAWELCWYRYEVHLDHLDDVGAEVRVLAKGTHLEEIAHEDRHINAVIDEHGALSLSGA
jgi:hypothetical protein